MRRVYGLMVLLGATVVAGVACSRQVPAQSETVSRVLALYAPGFRLGQSFEEIQRLGKIKVGEPYASYATGLMPLPLTGTGFSKVGIGFRSTGDHVRPSDPAIEFVLYSDSTAVEATAKATEQQLARIFAYAPKQGCGGASVAWRDLILTWDKQRGAHVALVIPVEIDPRYSFRPSVRIHVFGGEIEDEVSNYSDGPCAAMSK